jgi:hypothetical protein
VLSLGIKYPYLEYDVTNRQVHPVITENGMAIGNIIGGKKHGK